MISKETLRVLLALLSRVQVSPMSEGADQTYEQLKKARDEITEALKDPEERNTL